MKSLRVLYRQGCRHLGYSELELLPRQDVCDDCGMKLVHQRSQRGKKKIYCFSHSDGPMIADSTSLYCEGCKTSFFHSFKQLQGGGVVYFDPNQSEFFMPTSEIAFEIDFYRHVELQLYNHTPFQGIATIYNTFWVEAGHQGPLLDRQVLGDSYFRYILVDHLREVGTLSMTNLSGWSGLDQDLLLHQGGILNAFSRRWGMHHRCSIPGCRETAVGDGHMKCHRIVCAGLSPNHKECLEFDGAYVQTGCTRTPCMSSRFCQGCSLDAEETATGRGADAQQAQDSCRIAYLSRCSINPSLLDESEQIPQYKATFIGEKREGKWLPADIIDPYLIFQFHCYHVSGTIDRLAA